MRTLLTALLLSFCILLAAPSAAVRAAGPTPPAVLLVYDSLAIGTSREGNVEALKRLLASFGAQVTAISFDAYRPGMLARYDKVAAIRNAPDLDLTNEAYKQDFASFTGGYLHIGAQAPTAMQETLRLRTGTAVRESVTLTIGGIAQSAIPFRDTPFIAESAGTTYGSYASEIGELSAPYGVRSGRFAYVPYFEQGNLSELAMTYILKDWFHGTDGALTPNGTDGNTYALFTGVSPFSDMDRLERLADRLYASGIPFIVSAAPVFSNAGYPAMQRYLETLRHVQSQNGSVLVNAPAAAATISQDISVLHGQLEGFLDLLAASGVVPLGMTADLYWTYDLHYANDGMGFFDSVILFPDEQPLYRSRADSSRAFAFAPYSLTWSELRQFAPEGNRWQPFPIDTALTFELPEDETQLEETVNALADSWITFADFKTAPHVVRTAANLAETNGGRLWLNDLEVDLSGAREQIGADFAYAPQAGHRSFEALFTVQNNIFIVLILSSLVLFAFFIVLGYRLYKRKYLIVTRHAERQPVRIGETRREHGTAGATAQHGSRMAGL